LQFFGTEVPLFQRGDFAFSLRDRMVDTGLIGLLSSFGLKNPVQKKIENFPRMVGRMPVIAGFRFNAKCSFIATVSNFACAPQNEKSARQKQHISERTTTDAERSMHTPRMLNFATTARNLTRTMTELKKEQIVAKNPHVPSGQRRCGPYRL
jgi:hypothetical protein